LTHKFTTGAPNFIETGHMEPAPVDEDTYTRVKDVVFHALDSLQIRYGASHSELKIAEDGTIRLIEIGGRMGGDFIGSALVEATTGVDFVKAVIDVALGNKPQWDTKSTGVAAVRFVFNQADLDILNELKKTAPQYFVASNVEELDDRTVTDSASRFGYFLMRADNLSALLPYLPKE